MTPAESNTGLPFEVPAVAAEVPRYCGECGKPLVLGALICPACRALVYAERLEQVAHRARSAASVGNHAGAAEAWREALRLLPPDSAQHATIAKHLAAEAEAQAKASDETAQHPGRQGWRKLAGSAGVIGALLWKFKFVVVYALSKAKFLLFGLSKLSTLLSMFASFGLYWTWFGWAFAAGFVVSIYIHEMGHIWQLRQYGIRSTAPLFLPGFGAVVLLKEKFATAAQDARVGLAGPIWGMGAALACWVAAAVTANAIWIALAQAGALINLFNLIPVWQLDGGRAFHALSQPQRIRLAVLAALLWAALGAPMFFLIVLGVGYRLLFAKDPAPAADTPIEIQYAGLMVVLGLLSGLPVSQF